MVVVLQNAKSLIFGRLPQYLSMNQATFQGRGAVEHCREFAYQ